MEVYPVSSYVGLKSGYMKIPLLTVLLSLSCLGIYAQQRSYTIAFLNKKSESEKADAATEQKLMEGHMANIRRLGEEGKLLAAGPFEGGGGLFIFNTTSLEEAEGWLNTDPAVQAKRWNIEIMPYTPRKGSVCSVAGDITMVPYTFVRFSAIVEKFTASTYPTLIQQHDAYVERTVDPSYIVSEAVFGPNEGGVLILRSELPPDAFANDPGVQQGLIQVDVKKLYIAKGNFCE